MAKVVVKLPSDKKIVLQPQEPQHVGGELPLGQPALDHKAAEVELRKWAHVFESARWALVVINADGKTLDMFNPAFARLLGYTMEEMRTKRLAALLPYEEHVQNLKNFKKAAEIGHLVWEATGVRKNGDQLPLEVDLTVVKNDAGRPLYYIASIRDLTAYKKAQTEVQEAHEALEARVQERTEELAEANQLLEAELEQRTEVEAALKESNLKTAAILSSITDAYFHFDEGWRLTDLNKPAENILRKGVPELFNKNFWKEFPELKRGTFFIGCQQAVASRTPQHFESHFEFADRWFEAHAYPSADGLAVYLRDITERKIAEGRLRNKVIEIEQERAKDEALLDSIGEGIIAVDREGRIMFINRAAEIMFGRKASEVAGTLVDATMPIVDASGKLLVASRRPLMAAITTKKRSIHDEFFVVRSNRPRFPVSITVSPIIVDKQAVGAIGVYRDVTKEREIDKAKSEFVALASHQLRTPLTITSWYTEKLIKEREIGPADQQRYLNELYKANTRMIELVNALLDVSRIELGTLNIEPRLLDLRLAADAALEEFALPIEAKKIAVTKNYEAELPKIKADDKVAKIIFQNIISNAVKYCDNGSSVTVSLARSGEGILITIADTGYGIPESQQSKIFSKLFRADNAVEKEADGTGLGLYIVKSVVEQAGGSIRFESKENMGTTFFIFLPLVGLRRQKVDKEH